MVNKFNFSSKIFNTIHRESPFLILLIFIIFLYLINTSLVSPETSIRNKELIQKIQTEVEITLSTPPILQKFKENIFLKWSMVGLLLIGVLFFLGGLVLNVFYLVTSKKLKFSSTQKISVSEWTLLDILKVVVIIFFIWQLLYIFKNVIFNLLRISGSRNLISSLIFSTFFHIIAVACIFYYIKYKYNTSLYALGLTLRKFFKNVLVGFLGYISIVPLAIFALIISGVVCYQVGYESKPNPLFLIYFLPSKQLILVYLLLFISIIGPISEEIFFRGFLYKSLRTKFNVKTGILINSIIFAFLHIEPIGFAAIFLLSIMLSYIYEKTGSLVAPITAHIIHNTMVSAFMLLLRGVTFA